jgi:uncharacterized membrane protein YhaH (DUF805 family)
MSDVWYYADHGERVGPVSVEGLRAALAKFPDAHNIFVWRPGFNDWQRAGEVTELRAGGAAPPPAPFGQATGPGAAQPPADAYAQPGIVNLWFGFEGRINRAKFWLVGLVNFGTILVGAAVSYASGSTIAWVVIGLVYLGLLVSGLAVTIKRLHDRDRSAWWTLIFIFGPPVLSGIGAVFGQAGSAIAGLAGFGISIWSFVELGCLRGTQGPNRFGPDPLTLDGG